MHRIVLGFMTIAVAIAIWLNAPEERVVNDLLIYAIGILAGSALRIAFTEDSMRRMLGRLKRGRRGGRPNHLKSA